jgi:hypothetical protein
MTRFFFLVIIVFNLSSCGTLQSSVRPSSCSVEILKNELPQREFIRVARLDVHKERTFFVKSTLDDVVEELKSSACEKNADAIIEIDERSTQRFEVNQYHVSATAIKYTDKPAKTIQQTDTTREASSNQGQKTKPVISGLTEFNQHAIIISNQNYKFSKKLNTPHEDAKYLNKILTEKYNFKINNVVRIEDATREQIINAFQKKRESLSEKDSLLVFYAGHGRIDTETQRGYWLPIDAGESEANWLATDDVKNYLKAMKAKHVLVIADSCFSGSLTRDSGKLFSLN